MFNVLIKEDDFWNKLTTENATIWIKGWFNSLSFNDVFESLCNIDVKEIDKFISSLDGNFSIVIVKSNFLLIAVDRIRSTPLFFSKISNSIFVSNNPHGIIRQAEFDRELNENALLELKMSGFTIGNKTIFKKLYSLKSGECAIIKDNEIKFTQYYKYFDRIIEKDYVHYLEELYYITIGVFKKLVESVGDRQIVIPLSAGNDSRLVASALKHFGVKNVLCYSYGTENNFEARIAKVIAKKLGYKWVFIPLTHGSEKRFYNSNEYKDYLDYAETYSSVPYIQSLSTIKYLRELGLVADDAIFINGNSGDFISGSHITNLKKNRPDSTDVTDRRENILNSLVDKHFSLWGYLKTKSNLEKIKNTLWEEIKNSCGVLPDDNDRTDHLFYEYSEFIDRQSSYVISGQRAYEFYGYEWRLPLWDNDYLDFFVNVPAEYKVNQKLYHDMLKIYNFGGVWGDDIPVNKKSITPKYIIPLRMIAKIPFLYLGKERWKNFDKCVFHYWMDVTHMMDTTSYFRIVKDLKKKPRNHVSWHAEDYIVRMKNESFVGK